MKAKTDLSLFNNSDYRPGSLPKRVLWYLVSVTIFMNRFFPFMGPKRLFLRIFGASIGKGLVIKPCVNIKYPWHLEIGDHVWIGEKVWIDNLDIVSIGSHCCISQGALILSGNHDYTKPAFDLKTAPIVIEEGAWIGARGMVTSGVTVGSHAVLSVMSVANKDLDSYMIYQGNPAKVVRDRNILAE
ncbi:MAG: colanic acid biosynthesis acetyltransferase WcaF [Flavobacteriales bacterium]|nr:colanic acid biosynthesis acetyltransferase WcaF [Flavobacteriales bacterium]